MSEAIRNPEIVNSEISKVESDLNSRGIEASEAEKGHVHEVVGERIKEKAGAEGMPHYTPQAPKTDASTPSYFTPELQPLVQDLINIAWSKGLDAALSQALKSGNVALVDAFHDAIVDELFDLMVENKSVEKLAA